MNLKQLQESIADFLQVPGRESDILRHTYGLFDHFKFRIEQFIRHAHRDLAEQLDKAAVCIVAEARVSGLRNLSPQGLAVQAQVQDRVHHAGHRQRRAAAHRHQQRVFCIPEDFPRHLLQLLQLFPDLLHYLARQFVVGGIQVIEAGLGGNHKSGWHVQADLCHFTQIGALATQ